MSALVAQRINVIYSNKQDIPKQHTLKTKLAIPTCITKLIPSKPGVRGALQLSLNKK